MSFREKSAWISFVCILIFASFWLGHVLRIEFFPGRGVNQMVFVFGTMAALIALEVGLHVAIALQSPRDARTPKDEREKLIALKSSGVAFYVLLIGAFASIGTLHLNFNRYDMAACLMGTILLTLLARFATQIALYRRDA
jgi:hypothetical protein